MRFSSLALAAVAAGVTVAAPFSFPLANGFPALNTSALAAVYQLAGGTLPNGGLPTSLKPDGVQALQLIAANELFEVAYFSELVYNISTNVPGYECEPYVLDTLIAVVNQEELHAAGANGILANAGNETIQPCKYQFPVTNFDDAILLAQTFTDVVLGVLPVAQTVFAQDGGDETGLVQIFGSVIAQEGEQTGLYRFLQKKVASAAPFLTGGAPQFAYTAISQFFVPGSCPNIDAIGIVALPALTVETVPKAMNSTQLFSVYGTVNASNASMVYISGQNLPVTVPISNVNTDGSKTYFYAPFPYDAGFSRGLTIGALVSGSMPVFNSSVEVADATLYGPALIEIN